jgi:Domain of unknown function (DUF3516)
MSPLYAGGRGGQRAGLHQPQDLHPGAEGRDRSAYRRLRVQQPVRHRHPQLETLPLLDAESPDYALDVLTLVESILENPELILRKQLDRIKDGAIAQMKADGIEYEQRMEELEKLE